MRSGCDQISKKLPPVQHCSKYLIIPSIPIIIEQSARHHMIKFLASGEW